MQENQVSHIQEKLKLFQRNKEECVFTIVIWSYYRMGQYSDNDHREEAPHFSGLNHQQLNFRKMVVTRVQNLSSTRKQKRPRSPSIFCICSTDFCMLLYTTETYPNLYLPSLYDYGRISTVYRKILLNAKVY